ncbi:unnamed protein product [Cylicocyclus nassatus]|uniref:C-type lectin domain-containing protein n=1 Tax=Cylicocyclus nassatus TaxID=53992 RepID=A0AA36HDZ9_CYLNA|nr:unnamed protein product [Cylicocyclus nassatus]
MCSIKLLLGVLIPSLNAVDLNSTMQLLRGPDIYHGLSPLSNSDDCGALRSWKECCTCYRKMAPVACPARCESGWTFFDKTEACYKTFFGETFDGAENMCNVAGGHLTSIHSFEENRFVAGLAKMNKLVTDSRDYTWIGLHKMNSNNWRWTDGTKVDFKPWAPTCPKGEGNCVLLLSDVNGDETWLHKWANFPCIQNLRTYVCKKMALH